MQVYLRSALNEVMCNDELKNVFYFPSFEIATEVAQRIPGLGFGNDDSNSRHLDQEIIKGICDFFVFKCFPSTNAVLPIAPYKDFSRYS